MVLASVLGLPAEDWSAIATCTAVGVGVVAGGIAALGVRQTRRIRDEEARPYVIAYLEPSAGGSWVVDLVVKNLGATAATDISVTMEPAPLRAIDEGNADAHGLVLPAAMPLLVPGQEWRTLWDSTIQRHESDLPGKYTATVSFKDSHSRRSFTFTFVLDWDTIIRREFVTVYGLHDAAEALRTISKVVKGWSESGDSALSVTCRDGDARDQRDRERYEQRLRQREQPPDESA